MAPSFRCEKHQDACPSRGKFTRRTVLHGDESAGEVHSCLMEQRNLRSLADLFRVDLESRGIRDWPLVAVA